MATSDSIKASPEIIVLFDGICNLCNGAVQFIIKRDQHKKFMFASLQSSFGQSQLLKSGLDPSSLQSMIVIHNGIVFQQSDAALNIVKNLDGWWPSLFLFRFIPKVIRDAIYAFIARYRYQLFGKQDRCMVPTAELKARFVEV